MNNQQLTSQLNARKKEGYSLVLSLSHLCLIFPLELQKVSQGGRKGSFFLKKEDNSYSLQEWYDLFQSTIGYRIQQVILGEEASPFLAAVELIDKKITNGELELEFYFHTERLSQY